MRKRATAMLLAMLLVTGLCMGAVPAQAADDGSQILRIGLKYSSDALPAANLLPYDNSSNGYHIGYYDQSGSNFTTLWTVANTGITVVKDKLIYVASDDTYYDTMPSTYKAKIAPYHLQLNETYGSQSEAEQAVSRLKNAGLSAFPAYYNGRYVVRTGAYDTQGSAETARGQVSGNTGWGFTVVGFSSSCYTVTVTGSETILFEFDNNGSAMGIMPRAVSGKKADTWFKGYHYYGGFEYNRVNGNDISVVSIVSQSDYLKGVIPYEMSASWHVEALKVQGLCAKSYAVNSMGKHKSSGFDLCNTTHCQVYYGTKSATANSDRAIDEIVGKYVLYDGKVASTYYHSSSGGHTEDSENIWGNKVAYLKGVDDPYLKYVKDPNANWSFSVTLNDLTNILKEKNYDVTQITDYYVSKYSPYGNVTQVTFVDKSKGAIRFSGESARTIINSSKYGTQTKSHRYTISAGGSGKLFVNEGGVLNDALTGYYAIGSGGTTKKLTQNAADLKVLSQNGISGVTVGSSATGNSSTFVVTGSGSGHNIGMSQYGAKGMAENGFSAQDIIKHYFTGVSIGNVN